MMMQLARLKQGPTDMWGRYKGAIVAAGLSLLTAALFVLRSKEPSKSCNETLSEGTIFIHLTRQALKQFRRSREATGK